jgi:hypothetical protein
MDFVHERIQFAVLPNGQLVAVGSSGQRLVGPGPIVVPGFGPSFGPVFAARGVGGQVFMVRPQPIQYGNVSGFDRNGEFRVQMGRTFP